MAEDTAARPSAGASGVNTMAEDEHFVDKHQDKLIQRMSNTAFILDELLRRHVIQEESYTEIKALPNSQEQMRALFRGPLRSSGHQGKAIFYEILSKHEAYLIEDLKKTEGPTNIQECVQSTKKVLKKKNWSDWPSSSGISSGTKEKQQPSLIHRVETMASVIELLLETLKHLNHRELEKFKEVLQRHRDFDRRFSDIPWRLLMMRDRQDVVFFMVLTYGQQSVEKTKEVFKEMKRTDLVRRLSDSSSGPKKKHSLDKRLSALIHKVATMRAVRELLLETLDGLSYSERTHFKWLLQFSIFQRSLPHISWRRLLETDKHVLVDVMVEVCGQQSVEVTKEVLMDMNRTDLVQRLPETSSGPKAAGSSAEAFGGTTMKGEKRCLDEHWPALIPKVETMASVIELLLETLKHLGDWELHSITNSSFKIVLLSHTDFYKRFSDISLLLMNIRERQDIVFLLVLTYGEKSVDTTKEVLRKMKKTDLVQRLSDSSSGPKKKHPEEHQPALIKKVATMAAVKQLLWETLNDLSNEEVEKFKRFLQWIVSQKKLSDIPSPLSYIEDRARIVDVMMRTYGHQSVQLIREVLNKMNRTDLMHRLSETSSALKEKHSVDEHQAALTERTASIAAVKQILLETLKALSDEEREKFIWLLQFTYFQRGLPRISWSQLDWADRADALVDLMVPSCGHQSVEVTREVLMDMNRTDLVARLSETSSGLKEEHQSKPIQKEVTMTSVQKKLLETFKDLSNGELQQFKWLLQRTEMKEGLPRISRRRMEMADRAETVELMEQIYNQQAVEVTRAFLKEMNRSDLLERLSETSSGSGSATNVHPKDRRLGKEHLSGWMKGPPRSSELEGCGIHTFMQDSSDWTKLEPEVNSSDADEAPIYSLQSEAGNFECSVSGLRWVCKEKVSFKYQFCSLTKHMERMERTQYMPAGPLMDITVTAGKLFEVYLPHWICIDDNPAILDKFAVLHIEDCGDVVEKVSEVTSSHVKLCEPVFSLKMVLVKVGFSVEINCKVLIYKTNKPFLMLHVYLIPPDPALQQELNETESADGYQKIRKPHPKTPLKMNDWFSLTAHFLDDAVIASDTLQLIYESTDPNFMELFIENPDTDFTLNLTLQNKRQPVWTCVIKKDEYQSTSGPAQAEHFVDKHRVQLIDRVSNKESIASILDLLLDKKVIQQGTYDEILALSSSRDKMRRLYSGPLNAAGDDGKDVFYKILEEKEQYLIAELKRKK